MFKYVFSSRRCIVMTMYIPILEQFDNDRTYRNRILSGIRDMISDDECVIEDCQLTLDGLLQIGYGDLTFDKEAFKYSIQLHVGDVIYLDDRTGLILVKKDDFDVDEDEETDEPDQTDDDESNQSEGHSFDNMIEGLTSHLQDLFDTTKARSQNAYHHRNEIANTVSRSFKQLHHELNDIVQREHSSKDKIRAFVKKNYGDQLSEEEQEEKVEAIYDAMQS